MCYFFYDDKVMGTHITLSQLDAAAPVYSYPLGDKPVSQPALSQTLVGDSVIVVRSSPCLPCPSIHNFSKSLLYASIDPPLTSFSIY